MTQTFRITNGDWTIDKRSGRPLLIADGDKLRQDLREDLTIERQPNGFGAGLEQIVGTVADAFTILTLIQQRIQDSVTTMARLQDQTQRLQRPAAERIRNITRLNVYPVAQGGGALQTGYAFQLAVATVAGTTSSVSGVATGG